MRNQERQEKTEIFRPASRLQTRYRRLRDIQRPRYIGLRVSVSEALEGFLPLVRCESSGPPKSHPTVLGALPAFACAGADQLTLKLSQATENCKHESAVWCRGIGPSVSQAAETGFPLANCGQDVQ
jgi:hypothetical protein